MDDQRFLDASYLQDQGKLREAADEFIRIAEDTSDEIDKAAVLLNAATTLRALGDFDHARRRLDEIRRLPALSDIGPSSVVADERILWIAITVEIEDAEIYRAEGNERVALARLDDLFSRYQHRLLDPHLRDSYQLIQTRRAFLMADLGRWQEALTILESDTFDEPRELISFYMGHCYVSAHRYVEAERKLAEALRLGLPRHLEYRAHCELAMVYFRLRDYQKAKTEFEKSTETADASYIEQAQIWKRLEATCRMLGLKAEAEHYAKLASGTPLRT